MSSRLKNNLTAKTLKLMGSVKTNKQSITARDASRGDIELYELRGGKNVEYELTGKVTNFKYDENTDRATMTIKFTGQANFSHPIGNGIAFKLTDLKYDIPFTGLEWTDGTGELSKTLTRSQEQEMTKALGYARGAIGGKVREELNKFNRDVENAITDRIFI